MEIIIYTDGAAKGNPGPGGYGAVLMFGEKRKELSKGFRLTTNNRMELLAVIDALKTLKTNKYPVIIYSDSKYVVDAVTKGWLRKWQLKGFKNKANVDLWREYIKVAKKFKIEFRWVKGHAGYEENERCDQLAVFAAERDNLSRDIGYEEIIRQ